MGGAHFADVSRVSGIDFDGDGRALAITDWDGDGRLDMVLRNRSAPRLQIFHNRYSDPGRSLAFELRGNGTTCNSSAVNARVVVEAGGRSLTRTLYGGEGFLAQSSRWLHFGLGDAGAAERVTVHWPDGTRSAFADVAAGARYRIDQARGAEGLERLPDRPPSDLAQAEQRSYAPAGAARRAVLAAPLPVGGFPIPAFADAERRVEDLAGEPLLLNFWQVDCQGCLEDFGDFRRGRERLAEVGVRLVTLNADDPFDGHAARSMLRKFEILDEHAGYVGDVLPRLMEHVKRHVYGRRVSVPMAMPTSWLVDARGQLLVIYHGPVDLWQLADDVQALSWEHPWRPVLDRLSEGRRLVYDKRKLFELAEDLAADGFDDLARRYYELDREVRGFFMQNGELKTLRDFRYDGRD